MKTCAFPRRAERYLEHRPSDSVAEVQSHVKLIAMSAIQGIKCEPHVDPLLLTRKKGVSAEARHLNSLVPID